MPTEMDRGATRAARLSDRLRDEIVDGRLAPGEKLNLERLRAEFDVSLSPLREAMAGLAGRGLLDYEGNRGCRVAPVSDDEFRDVVAMRASLEPLALEHVLRRADPRRSEAIREALGRLNETGPGISPPARHAEFHRALIADSGSPVLDRTLAALADLDRRYRTGTTPSLASHQELARAAMSGDPEAACALLRDHILAEGPGVPARKPQLPLPPHAPRVFLLNGPNLNLQGERQPDLYGYRTLAEVEAQAVEAGMALGLDVLCRQSNHEGQIIDWIHEARHRAAGLVINPGAFGHTSIAILDALNAFDGPVLEVHVSNIHRREEFRRHSYVSLRADGVIAGFGVDGYTMALQRMRALIAA